MHLEDKRLLKRHRVIRIKAIAIPIDKELKMQ